MRDVCCPTAIPISFYPLLQDELAEKAELQEALIKSEELRLGLAKTLIDTQVSRGPECQLWMSENGWTAGAACFA